MAGALIGGLVLAAGGGSRFGGPKQLADLDGRPVLEHVLRAMAVAPLDRVVVVLGSRRDAVLRAVGLHGAEPVECELWEEGQAASLRAGIEALEPCDAAVVVLGDQPLLSPRAVTRVLAARRGSTAAIRATYAGRPGHPVVLERDLFERVRRLRGDVGARAMLGEVTVLDVPCDGLGRPDDVDTPEELEAVRAASAAFEEAIGR